MSRFRISSLVRFNKHSWRISLLAALTGTCLLLASTPALAHHMMGSRLPATFFEGFISGLAHPLIGFDHFAFIVSVGLLSATKRQGFLIPIAFVLTAMLGAGLHLMGLTLPGVELFVSGSILLFGLLLVLKDSLDTTIVIGLAAIAGVCHGYAYGESIFGAEMTPLVAYLAGFTAIQLIVAMFAFWVSKVVILKREPEQQSFATLRSAGLVICGIGLSFLSSQIVSAIFPVL